MRGRFFAFLIGLGLAAINGAAVAAAEPVNNVPIDTTLPRSHPASFNPAFAPPLPTPATQPQTKSAGMTTQSLLLGLPTVTGRTPGQFAVSPTGAATYSVPLWTPPGVRGIDPSLALVYSSNSSNGLLGVGWSLAGFSTVERCNRTYAQDSVGGAPQLDSTDRFCLDGSRLRSVSGTYGADLATYQTEIANFSKVISHGTAGSGPAWFEVLGKNGLIYEYGHTTDAAILASGATSVRVWALSLVKDRIGNSMKFVYTNDTTNGSYRPLRIEYTYSALAPSTHNYEVGFTYQSRSTNDGLWEYSEGGKNNEFNLVSQIAAKSWDGSSYAIVKSYNFDYANGPATSRSRLTTIQECSPTDCLQPSTISYQDGQTGWGSEIVSSGNTSLSSVMHLDVNGDGLMDLVYPNSATSTFWYALGATSGTYAGPYNTTVSSTNYLAAIPCDYNSDGKMDVLVPNGSSNWRVLFFQSAGSAFTFTDTTTPVGTAITGGWATAGDVDGDGRDDIIYWVSGGAGYGTTDRIYTRLNTGSGFSSTATQLYALTTITGDWKKFGLVPLGSPAYQYRSRVQRADFNGDGRNDLMFLVRNCQADNVGQCGNPGTLTYTWNVLLSQANGTYAALGIAFFSQTGLPNAPPLLGDFNGDDCTDVAYSVSAAWRVQFGTCWRAGAASPFDTAVNTGVSVIGSTYLVMDWDGDGRDDLLQPNGGGTWGYARATGSSLGAWTSLGYSISNAGYIAVADVNGDGQFDIAYGNASTVPSVRLHNGVKPDLATSFTDGYGMNASPSYVPITQNNHSANTGASYPDIYYQWPLHVVSGITASDGAGGTYSQSYWYYYARMNLQGRGFDGFYAKRISDSRWSLYSYDYYNQTFPTTGMLTSSELYQSNNVTLVRQVVNTATYTTLDATANNQRYMPYVSQSVAKQWELGGTLNGSLITQQTTNFTLDSYGNAYDVTTSTVDQDATSPWYAQTWSSHIAKTITNDTTNWCLGIPTQTTVQNTLPGGSNLTRTTSSTVDYANCRVTQDVVEPSSTTLKVTTTYGFDTCGNVNSAAVVGKNPDTTDMATRTTSASFGSRCQFPESVTNAENETTQIAYRYDVGLKSSSTDPNAISVGWLYDNYGRMTRENRPDGTFTTWTRYLCDASNSYCGVSDLREETFRTDYTTGSTAIRYAYFFYDGFGRQRYDEELNLAGSLTYDVRLYDQWGRTATRFVPVSSGGWHFHSYTYDQLSRLTSDALYLAGSTFDRQTTLAYAGRAVTITDAKGNVTTKYANVLGQLGRVSDPSPGGQTNYAYEPFGQLTSATDPAGNVTSWSYNLNGALTGTSDVDRGSWSYTPNSLGETVSQTDAIPRTTTFVYDKVSRLTSRAELEGTSTWTWGTSSAAKNIGKLSAMSGPGYSESYSYDSLGRPATTTYNADVAYTATNDYNSTTGLLDNITYPASTGATPLRAQYLYTNGILSQVRDYNAPSTVWWQLNAEDARGFPVDEGLHNGVRHALSNYDELTGHLNWRTSGKNATYDDQQYIRFQYDKNENLTDRIDVLQSNLTEHFVYDTLNRLDYSTLNGSTNLDVTLDAIGNITYRSDVGNYMYHSTRKHAVASTSNGWSFTYDNNGNMQTGRGATIGWTSYNMPSSVTNGSISSAFYYTPDRDYWKQVAQYAGGPETTIYVGGLMEKVIGASGTDYHHMIRAGSSLIVVSRSTGSNNDTYFVSQDALGSSSVVTNTVDSVTVKQSFAAYGGRRGSNWTGTPTAGDYTAIANSTRRGYTGHTELDNLGLVHMNGRAYDPAIGRVISADPTIPDFGLSQSYNRYSYVSNGPLTLVDPNGFKGRTFMYNGSISNPFTQAFVSTTYVGSYASSGQWSTTDVKVDGVVVLHQNIWYSNGSAPSAGGFGGVIHLVGNFGAGPRESGGADAGRKKETPKDEDSSNAPSQDDSGKCWNGQAGNLGDGVSGMVRKMGNDAYDLGRVTNPLGGLLQTLVVGNDPFGSNNTNTGILGADLAVIPETLAGGGAGLGLSGTALKGSRAAETTFSHMLPNRWGGPRSVLNGRVVSEWQHSMHDPSYFLKGQTAADKWNPLLRMMDRIPPVYRGALAGWAFGELTDGC